MSDTAPAGSPPSPAAVAAAASIDPAPAPPPAPEPDDDLEPLEDGVDMFPRKVVEKTRAEAAKWRTQFREIDGAFEGYTPEEKQRFLELASMLHANPEAALDEFEMVTNNLRKLTGKATNVSEEAPTPPEAPEAPSTPPADDIDARVAAAVEQRLTAEREAAARQAEIDATLAEAESLDDRYKDPVAKAQLFAKAQREQISLAEAHAALTGDFEAAVEAAVQAKLAELSTGRAHPPRLPTGDPANVQDQGPPKTLEEARARANQRLDAAYGRQG